MWNPGPYPSNTYSSAGMMVPPASYPSMPGAPGGHTAAMAAGASMAPPGMPPMGGHGGPMISSFTGNWFQCFYQRINPQEMHQMREWFARMDMDRSGTVTAHELQNVSFGGFSLGYDVASKLVRVFDQDHNMSIDFFEFASMHKFISIMQGIFTACDTNRDGSLDAMEIMQAMQMAGFQVNLSGIKALFHRQNKYNTGARFSGLLEIAADYALFDVLDTDRDGWVGMNFDGLLNLAGVV